MAAKLCPAVDEILNIIEDLGSRDSGSSGSEVVFDSDKDPEYLPTVKQARKQFEDDNTTTTDSSLSDAIGEKPGVEPRGRKRMRRVNNQTLIQRRRIHGEEYMSRRGKGKLVNKKKPGPDCKCRMKCFEIVTPELRSKLFLDFWRMGSYDIQTAYLFGCMRKHNVTRRTKNNGSQSRRSCTIKYYVLGTTGNRHDVCKVAFLNIHGLQNNRGRIENLASRLNKGVVSPPIDQRGKHDKHPAKYSEADVADVKLFIDNLPKYTSHYSRKDNPGKLYMSMEYTVESCYTQYNEECLEKGKQPVSKDKFRRIFTEDYNISFKHPKTDTCSVCDALNVSIQEAKQDNGDGTLRQLLQKQELHHRKAEAGQDAIKLATKQAKEQGIYAITFDLQQALPTPKLSTGPTFYKKKLFCYNLSVHSLGDNQGYFYVWNESIAGRGADEIGSCLLKHFEVNDIRGDKLIAISDNCSGQNKNWTIVSTWLRIIAEGRFRSAEQIFPQVGHTMLPSDRDFGIVEKHVQAHCQFVYSPEQWVSVLKTCRKKCPFIVYEMKQEDFLNISVLRDKFNQSTVTDSGTKFGIRTAVRLLLSEDEDGSVINMSETYNGIMEPMSMRKKGRPTSFLENFSGCLLKKYGSARHIEASKLRDVLSCLPWIPPAYHNFYKNFTPAQKDQ